MTSVAIGLLFVLQFCILVGILFLELFNLFHKGQKLSMPWVWMLFIGYFVIWLVGFSIFLIGSVEVANAGSDPSPAVLAENLVFGILSKLESWFIAPHVLFFFLALMFHLTAVPEVVLPPRERRNSRKAYLFGEGE